MELTKEEFKKLFYSLTKKYQISTKNKAALFYDLTFQIEKCPGNQELYQLLVMSITSSSYLLAHFAPEISEKDDEYEFRVKQGRIKKLQTAISNEQKQIQEWEKIQKHIILPDFDKLFDPNFEQYCKEADFLSGLYQQYTLLRKKDCPQLHSNLLPLCRIVKADPYLCKITPFFFYQIMVKHTRRLAAKQDFQFSLKSLWNYQEYNIWTDNGKNYTKYSDHVKLFLALCRYYKSDVYVDMQLSRYAFSHNSNLIEWLQGFHPKKARKCRTRLSNLLHNAYWSDVTYIEEWMPENDWDPYKAYGVSNREVERYLFGIVSKNEADYHDAVNEISRFIMQDIWERHTESLLICKDHVAVNPNPIYDTVEEIYQESRLDKRYPAAIPLNFRLAHIYDVLLDCLDIWLKSRVEEAVKSTVAKP